MEHHDDEWALLKCTDGDFGRNEKGISVFRVHVHSSENKYCLFQNRSGPMESIF